MSEVKKLFDALSSDKDRKHKDLKLMLRDGASSLEEIAKECRIAIEHHKAGTLKVS